MPEEFLPLRAFVSSDLPDALGRNWTSTLRVCLMARQPVFLPKAIRDTPAESARVADGSISGGNFADSAPLSGSLRLL